MNTNNLSLHDQLKQEIPFQWRTQSAGEGWSTLVAYIDSRDAQDRLDEVLGAENWQDEYYALGGVLFSRVGIKIQDNWIWKSDCGTESAIEKEKGAASDAFKRACVKHGLGRFLYDKDIIFTGATKNKKGKLVSSPTVKDMQMINQAGNASRYLDKNNCFRHGNGITLFVREILKK